MSIKDYNISLIEKVALRLDELLDEVVFLGGATTALLTTDPQIPDARQTLDVDCIIDIISFVDYNKLGKRLREKGFTQSIEKPIICRWQIESVIVDIMPTDKRILGFANRWSKDALLNAQKYNLKPNLSINLITPIFFIATKLEAFKLRGNNDYLASHDLEDIITIVDGRKEIIEDLRHANDNVKKYIIDEFIQLNDNRHFHDALPGHLNYGSISGMRLSLLNKRIDSICQLSNE